MNTTSWLTFSNHFPSRTSELPLTKPILLLLQMRYRDYKSRLPKTPTSRESMMSEVNDHGSQPNEHCKYPVASSPPPSVTKDACSPSDVDDKERCDYRKNAQSPDEWLSRRNVYPRCDFLRYLPAATRGRDVITNRAQDVEHEQHRRFSSREPCHRCIKLSS